MSRQLAFSSAISAMVMAFFALSVTVRAEAAPFAPASMEASGR
jgi:hypothetical protein